ncbi:hypothetical protein MHLP_01760 [Candidatus Mycoplasma haematolamae str. Purdue]|uniref:Uncharacterized protein n=1 Tax=Mycoplasma haematolamae (strain Purdue) TaxID=1212765 RepID=I7C617_MYCHA|nr:hypothetical protein [Candidatus Mycoplasma haematolamae]AFO51932.1 hypothetical protein MHLP_01760 [Candidatus Mycoplasma haematolamae str. Purdue]
MSKILLICSGLTAGTAVSGGAHLVKNVRPNWRKVAVSRQNRSLDVENGDSRSSDNLLDQKPPVDSAQARDYGEDLLEKEVDSPSSTDEILSERPESNPESSLGNVPAGPRTYSAPSEDRTVTDILSESPVNTSAKSTERLKKGTKAFPDVICVAEETGDVTYDGLQRQSKLYSPACIKKERTGDYEKARTSSVCTVDINWDRNSGLTENLSHPTKERCRYWDSYIGSNNTQLSFEDSHIPDVFRN